LFNIVVESSNCIG